MDSINSLIRRIASETETDKIGCVREFYKQLLSNNSLFEKNQFVISEFASDPDPEFRIATASFIASLCQGIHAYPNRLGSIVDIIYKLFNDQNFTVMYHAINASKYALIPAFTMMINRPEATEQIWMVLFSIYSRVADMLLDEMLPEELYNPLFELAEGLIYAFTPPNHLPPQHTILGLSAGFVNSANIEMVKIPSSSFNYTLFQSEATKLLSSIEFALALAPNATTFVRACDCFARIGVLRPHYITTVLRTLQRSVRSPPQQLKGLAGTNVDLLAPRPQAAVRASLQLLEQYSSICRFPPVVVSDIGITLASASVSTRSVLPLRLPDVPFPPRFQHSTSPSGPTAEVPEEPCEVEDAILREMRYPDVVELIFANIVQFRGIRPQWLASLPEHPLKSPYFTQLMETPGQEPAEINEKPLQTGFHTLVDVVSAVKPLDAVVRTAVSRAHRKRLISDTSLTEALLDPLEQSKALLTLPHVAAWAQRSSRAPAQATSTAVADEKPAKKSKLKAGVSVPTASSSLTDAEAEAEITRRQVLAASAAAKTLFSYTVRWTFPNRLPESLEFSSVLRSLVGPHWRSVLGSISSSIIPPVISSVSSVSAEESQLSIPFVLRELPKVPTLLRPLFHPRTWRRYSGHYTYTPQSSASTASKVPSGGHFMDEFDEEEALTMGLGGSTKRNSGPDRVDDPDAANFTLFTDGIDGMSAYMPSGALIPSDISSFSAQLLTALLHVHAHAQESDGANTAYALLATRAVATMLALLQRLQYETVDVNTSASLVPLVEQREEILTDFLIQLPLVPRAALALLSAGYRSTPNPRNNPFLRFQHAESGSIGIGATGIFGSVGNAPQADEREDPFFFAADNAYVLNQPYVGSLAHLVQLRPRVTPTSLDALLSLTLLSSYALEPSPHLKPVLALVPASASASPSTPPPAALAAAKKALTAAASSVGGALSLAAARNFARAAVACGASAGPALEALKRHMCLLLRLGLPFSSPESSETVDLLEEDSASKRLKLESGQPIKQEAVLMAPGGLAEMHGALNPAGSIAATSAEPESADLIDSSRWDVLQAGCTAGVPLCNAHRSLLVLADAEASSPHFLATKASFTGPSYLGPAGLLARQFETSTAESGGLSLLHSLPGLLNTLSALSVEDPRFLHTLQSAFLVASAKSADSKFDLYELMNVNGVPSHRGGVLGANYAFPVPPESPLAIRAANYSALTGESPFRTFAVPIEWPLPLLLTRAAAAALLRSRDTVGALTTLLAVDGTQLDEERFQLPPFIFQELASATNAPAALSTPSLRQILDDFTLSTSVDDGACTAFMQECVRSAADAEAVKFVEEANRKEEGANATTTAPATTATAPSKSASTASNAGEIVAEVEGPWSSVDGRGIASLLVKYPLLRPYAAPLLPREALLESTASLVLRTASEIHLISGLKRIFSYNYPKSLVQLSAPSSDILSTILVHSEFLGYLHPSLRPEGVQSVSDGEISSFMANTTPSWLHSFSVQKQTRSVVSFLFSPELAPALTGQVLPSLSSAIHQVQQRLGTSAYPAGTPVTPLMLLMAMGHAARDPGSRVSVSALLLRLVSAAGAHAVDSAPKVAKYVQLSSDERKKVIEKPEAPFLFIYLVGVIKNLDVLGFEALLALPTTNIFDGVHIPSLLSSALKLLGGEFAKKVLAWIAQNKKTYPQEVVQMVAEVAN